MSYHSSIVTTEQGTQSLALFAEGQSRAVPGTHPNFAAIVKAVLAKESYETIVELIDVVTSLNKRLTRVSDRVVIRGGEVLLDGSPVESELTDHIISMLEAGDENYKGYVLFLENLASNPSLASRGSLFNFLRKQRLTITEDGHFIGYKGVQNTEDYLSITRGNEDVYVTLNGETEVRRGNIPNPVGAIVELPRDEVNPDSFAGCAVGLHVGSFNYASGWKGSQGALLTVKVNPRDVVTVPSSEVEKMRVCRYVVLEVNAGGEYNVTSLVTEEPVEEVESYDSTLGYDADYEKCYCDGESCFCY